MNKFLQRAFDIASAVDPHAVAPNPRVGCVIVSDGEIISEGAHEYFGGPHAEVNALEQVHGYTGTRGKECEVYVTLEPCDSYPGKKTGSCTDRLIALNPKKIVIGVLDPKFNGGSVQKMREAGIEVEVQPSVYSKQHTDLNPFFDYYQEHKKPWITLKIGQSLDGKITGGNPYITNQKSLEQVHQMRAQYSTILTTTETVLADDPGLDTRFDKGTNPNIIILGQREIPPTAKIWQIGDRDIHQFETLDDFLDSDLYGRTDSIMTECGAQMNTLLLEQGLVHEIQLFTAPKIIGQGKKANFEKELNLESFQLESLEALEGDIWMRFTV